MTEYINEKGQILKVSSGISSGEHWMTYRVKNSGSLQRVKSKFLPMRATKQEAQEDLDRYAEERGLPLIEEAIPVEPVEGGHDKDCICHLCLPGNTLEG